MTRRLSLKRETLTELSADDLVAVNGAAVPSGIACPSSLCISVKFGECVTWSCNVA